jgi:transcriptional regulator with XRE-family HTH domain
MTSRPTAHRGEFSAIQRRRCGSYLRKLRLAAELTQVALAEKIGDGVFYTFISQLESGRGFVPPERYEAFAKALGVDLQEFAIDMIRFSNPFAWAAIWGGKKERRAVAEEFEQTGD